MFVFFNGVADIERTAGVYVLEIRCHVEGNAVDYASGGIVDQLKFDVFEVAAYKSACAEVFNATCAECGYAVAGAERREESQD